MSKIAFIVHDNARGWSIVRGPSLAPIVSGPPATVSFGEWLATELIAGRISPDSKTQFRHEFEAGSTMAAFREARDAAMKPVGGAA